MTVASISTKSLLGIALVAPITLGLFWAVDRWASFGRLAEGPPGLAPTPLLAISSPILLPAAAVEGETRDGVAGITSPMLSRADDAELADADRVIGVVVDGESRAYAVKAFELRTAWRREDAGVQIVCDYVGRRPICVTHCARSQVTRVFAGDESPNDFSPAFDVRVVEGENGLVLVVNGDRYPHRSPEIPLKDVQFVTTTWGQWRSTHPDSFVYLRG